jgi:hypothetical protein
MTLTLTPETEARLLAVAARRGEAPETVLDAAVAALWEGTSASTTEDSGESEEEKQRRLHRIMQELLARTQETVSEPYDSPVRAYYRESEIGKPNPSQIQSSQNWG